MGPYKMFIKLIILYSIIQMLMLHYKTFIHTINCLTVYTMLKNIN